MQSDRSDEPEVVSFDDESLIVVDEQNRVLDYMSKVDCHRGEGVLHRAFSVFLFDTDGQILIQQRSAEKALWPLFWSNSCCSHPRKGESVKDAALRRIREELSLSSELQSLFSFQYHAPFGALGSEREHCEVLIGLARGEVARNRTEVADTRWMPVTEFDRQLEAEGDRYTPWLHIEWQTMRKDHWPVIEKLWRQA